MGQAQGKPKQQEINIMTTSKYRFENGKLFKFDASSNAYVFCFSSFYAKTKSAAIKAFEKNHAWLA